MIEIERVKKACEKEAFLMKGYTERERKIIKEDRNKCAGNFAAKDVYKRQALCSGKVSPKAFLPKATTIFLFDMDIPSFLL